MKGNPYRPHKFGHHYLGALQWMMSERCLKWPPKHRGEWGDVDSGFQ